MRRSATKASLIVVFSLLATSGALGVDSHIMSKSLYIHSETIALGYRRSQRRNLSVQLKDSDCQLMSQLYLKLQRTRVGACFEWKFKNMLRSGSSRRIEDFGTALSRASMRRVFVRIHEVGLNSAVVSRWGRRSSDVRRIYAPFDASLPENDTRAMPSLDQFARRSSRLTLARLARFIHMKLTNAMRTILLLTQCKPSRCSSTLTLISKASATTPIATRC